MNVREEIEKYSAVSDKPILQWLFSKYHWQFDWHFVANCTFVGKYPNDHRVWVPKTEGIILYKHYHP